MHRFHNTIFFNLIHLQCSRQAYSYIRNMKRTTNLVLKHIKINAKFAKVYTT